MPTIDNWRALREATEPGATTELFVRAVGRDTIRALLDERDRLSAEVEALRADAVVVIDGHNIRPADVLRRVFRNLKVKKGRMAWAAVSDMTAHGSTVSAGLCEWAGIDPDTGAAIDAARGIKEGGAA